MTTLVLSILNGSSSFLYTIRTTIKAWMSMNLVKIPSHIFSSPEPEAQGELIVWDSSRRPSVRPSTLSNMNISETSWPIIIKFHQEHHWGGGLTA